MNNINIIYVQSCDIDNFGFIKQFDYCPNNPINTIKYTKKFTDAMKFPDEFFTTEVYNCLERYLDSINVQYRILKW